VVREGKKVEKHCPVNNTKTQALGKIKIKKQKQAKKNKNGEK